MEFEPRYSLPERIEIIFGKKNRSLDADNIRKILLEDNKCIKNMISMGGVSNKRLNELENDRPAQVMYDWIIRMKNFGGECAEEANDQILNLALDDFAGFLMFKRKFYERKLSLKLISDED